MAKTTPAIILKHCTIHIHVPEAAALPATDHKMREIHTSGPGPLVAALGNLAATDSTLGRLIDQARRVSQETAERSLDQRTAEQRYADEIGQGPLDIEAKRAAVQRAIEIIEHNSQALQEGGELHEIDLPDEALPAAIEAGLLPAAIQEATRRIERNNAFLGHSQPGETTAVSPEPLPLPELPAAEVVETTPGPAPEPAPAPDGRRCPYPGCTELISRQAVACRKHWRQVKKAKSQAAHLVDVAHRKNGALQPQQA